MPADGMGSIYKGVKAAYGAYQLGKKVYGAYKRYGGGGSSSAPASAGGSRQASGKGWQPSYRKKGRRSYKSRGASKGGYRRASLSFARSRKAPVRARKGVTRGKKLDILAGGVSVDTFIERNVVNVAASSGNEDHQLIGLCSLSSGIDMNYVMHLIQSAFDRTPSQVLAKIGLFHFERVIKIHPLTNTRMMCEVTRWRPRFDNQFTPAGSLALAALGNDAAPDLSIPGATLFDDRTWTSMYKAVKSYKKIIQRGRAWTIKTSRKWKHGKVIDTRGEWYYTTTGSTTSTALATFGFWQKAGLSEVYTYRVHGDSLVGGTGVYTLAYPAIFIEDIRKVSYCPTVLPAKSAFNSEFSVAQNTAVASPFFLNTVDGAAIPSAI